MVGFFIDSNQIIKKDVKIFGVTKKLHYLWFIKSNDMQKVTVITQINESVKVQIEGVGTVRQIEVAEKLYKLGLITYKNLRNASKWAFSNEFLTNAINAHNLYPKQF